MLNLKKISDTKHPGNLGHYEEMKPKIGIKGKDTQLKSPENIFNKIIEEKFSSLKKEIVSHTTKSKQNNKLTKPENSLSR